MDSISKRVSQLQQSQGQNQKIPSFGYDYRVKANYRRNSDHSIPGAYQTAQLVNPSEPRSPAKFMTVSQESSPTPTSGSPRLRIASSLMARKNTSQGCSGETATQNQRVKEAKSESRVSWNLPEEHAGVRRSNANNTTAGRTNRGLPRPDSMYLPETSSMELSQEFSDMKKTPPRETSFLNFNIQPASYKSVPTTHEQYQAQSKQVQMQQQQQQQQQQPQSRSQQLNGFEQQMQQSHFHPTQSVQQPQAQQQQIPSYAQPLNALQQPSPSYLLLGDVSQLAGLNQGQFMNFSHPTAVSAFSGLTSSVFGLIGNSPAYVCAPQQTMPAHLQPGLSGGYQQPVAQVLPSSAMIRPQVAIVATDPATLRALLTGGLNPQSFLQPIIIPQQQTFPATCIAQMDNQPVEQPYSSGSETPPCSTYSPQMASNMSSENARVLGPARLQTYSNRAQTPSTFVTPQSHNTYVQTPSRIEPNQHQGSERCWVAQSHSEAERNGNHEHLHQSTQLEGQTKQNNMVQKDAYGNALDLNREVVVRSRHATSGVQLARPQQQHTPPTKEYDTPSQPKLEDEQRKLQPSSDPTNQSLPRIGHPPRTLRYLTRQEMLETGTHQEEVKHILSTATAVAYREPKKLEAIALFEKSKANGKLLRKQVSTEHDVRTTEDSDILGRRRDPNSISAYYEKIKQRGNRPLSAYRPSTVAHDEDYQIQEKPSHTRSNSSAPRQAQVEEKPEVQTVERRRTPVRRAVTFANENSRSPVRTLDPDNNITQPSKDPTVMSVAERTRRWLQVRERDMNDRYRYSTCGFIDQDLIDCQELVPVEDRVKMFDSGMHLPKDSDDQIPTKLGRENTNTSRSNLERPLSAIDGDQRDKRAITPSKTVAVVNLQTNRSTIGGVLASRSAVGLQHLRLGRPEFSQKPSGATQPKARSPPVDSPSTPLDDDLTRMSIVEKRRIFSREHPPKTSTNARITGRRKTQPVTLDDLARANQIILARLDGRSLESPSSILRDDNESFGFQERASEVSTPEASLVSF